MMAYSDKMGHKPFIKYLNTVYVYLDKMEIGSSFDLEKYVGEETLDLFVKCACDFMLQTTKLDILHHSNNYKFNFTEDFKIIYRT